MINAVSQFLQTCRNIRIKFLSWAYIYTTLHFFRQTCDSNKEIDRETERERGTETDRHTDTQTDTQTDRQTDRQRQRQRDRDRVHAVLGYH